MTTAREPAGDGTKGQFFTQHGYTRKANVMTGPWVLEHIDALTEGFYVEQMPLYRNQELWQQWYDCNYQRLFPTPSFANGMKFLDGLNALVKLPMFRIASDWIGNAAMSDMPNLSGVDDGQREWWNQNRFYVERALQRATDHWKILDYAVLVVEADGALRAWDPKYYYRIGLPDNPDADVGHVLLMPWGEFSLSQQQQAQDTSEPNRITVVKIMDGASTVQTFQYNGGRIGQALTAPQASSVRAVFTAGEGDSWYGPAQDIVAAMCVNFSMALVELNHYTNRPRLLPSSSIDAIATAAGVSPGSPAGQRAIMRMLNEELLPILSADKDDVSVGMGELFDAPQQDDRRALNEYGGDIFAMASGLTPSSFGIGIGRGESGVAREKAQDAAGAKIRRYRRQIESFMPDMARAMGMNESAEGIKFSWIVPPFQTLEAREEQIRADFQAGLLTANEAREEMGRGAIEGGDELASVREERIATMDREAMGAQRDSNNARNNLQ